MMRKGAKHRVGGAVREGERQREREREREEETEELQRRREREGGMHMVGRLEEGLDGQRERRGQKKGSDVVTVGGGGSGCILPAQPAGTNKRA